MFVDPFLSDMVKLRTFWRVYKPVTVYCHNVLAGALILGLYWTKCGLYDVLFTFEGGFICCTPSA
jgi:hypothetical protein